MHLQRQTYRQSIEARREIEKTLRDIKNISKDIHRTALEAMKHLEETRNIEEIEIESIKIKNSTLSELIEKL